MEEELTIKKPRIWEIDFLRGLAIIMMILDHFCYDCLFLPHIFSNFYQINNPFVNFLFNDIGPIYSSDVRNVFHVIFVGIFLMLVGISCHFSKNNLKRGLLLLLVQVIFGTIMEVVSFLLKEDFSVWFGILYAISFSILATVLFDFLLKKVKYKQFIYLGMGVILVAIGLIFHQFTQYNYVSEITVSNFFKVILGINAYGADYFPLFPLMGFCFIGKFIGEFFYNDRKSLLPKLDKAYNKPFCFVGRHSIIFYLAHQVVLVLILGIIMLSLGYKLAL